MKLRSWLETAQRALRNGTRAAGLLLCALMLSGQPVSAKDFSFEDAQCNNDGACCDELNAFWKEKVHHLTESKMMEPHPLSKDFVALDSTEYRWPEMLACPTEYSKLIGGLKLLHDFSVSDSAHIHYYKWVMEVLKSAGYPIVILGVSSSFAAAKHTMLVLSFSVNGISILSEVEIAGNFVHEAFHVAKRAPHVVCDHGQLKGKTNCDETFSHDFANASGSYSAQILFLHDYIQSGSDLYLAGEAQAHLDALVKNQINRLPEFGPDGVTPFLRYYGVE